MPRVGGRSFDEDAEGVRRKMRGVEPEPIREHYVEIDGVKYPPKQVLARATGWDRLTFTTMEAQRVIGRLGFRCRRVGDAVEPQGHKSPPTREDRIAAVEADLAILQQAVIGLGARIAKLEGAP